MKLENKLILALKSLKKEIVSNDNKGNKEEKLLEKTVDSGKPFEKVIKDSFSQNGFELLNLKSLKNLKDKNDDDKLVLSILDNNKEKITSLYYFDQTDIKIPASYNNKYITQPYGSQSFPDVILFYEGKIHIFDVKYLKEPKAKCMNIWNASMPKKNVVYLMCRKDDKPTFFLGQELISEEEEKLYNAWKDFAEKLRKETEEMTEKLKTKKGFHAWYREAYHRSGENINDFLPETIKERETNVYKFLNGGKNVKKESKARD
jgi:hypothetical protein